MKLSKYFSFLTVFILTVLVSTQKVFADMLPPGDFDKVPKDERTAFFDVVEPQYVLIGLTVILGIIVSFAFMAKLRDGDQNKK